MPSNRPEKVFQPDSNGPDFRLVYESFSDNPNASLYRQEPTAAGWENVGQIEFTLGPTHTYGDITTDGTIEEWAWTHYHATGDRTKVSHRLVASDDGSAVDLRHELRREMVLGPEARREAREHDWRVEDAWRVSRDGIDERGEVTA